MSNIPFPSVIDSSMISAFRSCPTRAMYEYFAHWKPKFPSVHLHAGKAFARGLEVARKAYYTGMFEYAPEAGGTIMRSPGMVSESIACGFQALLTEYGDFECPPDSAKSAERTAGAFEFYFEKFPLESDPAVPVTLPDGKRGIEFSFAEPLDFLHPETGDPLTYVGRFDMLVDYAGGRYGEDDKTTSQLGASWGRQWDLRSQFTSYCWGAGRGGMELQGFLVRGISILKTKYDGAQALTYRPKWMIDEWYEQLIEGDLPRMAQMWESGKWQKSLAEACNEYGGCGLKQVCMSAPRDRISWLETSFERRRWDPVTRQETKL